MNVSPWSDIYILGNIVIFCSLLIQITQMAFKQSLKLSAVSMNPRTGGIVPVGRLWSWISPEQVAPCCCQRLLWSSPEHSSAQRRDSCYGFYLELRNAQRTIMSDPVHLSTRLLGPAQCWVHRPHKLLPPRSSKSDPSLWNSRPITLPADPLLIPFWQIGRIKSCLTRLIPVVGEQQQCWGGEQSATPAEAAAAAACAAEATSARIRFIQWKRHHPACLASSVQLRGSCSCFCDGGGRVYMRWWRAWWGGSRPAEQLGNCIHRRRWPPPPRRHPPYRAGEAVLEEEGGGGGGGVEGFREFPGDERLWAGQGGEEEGLAPTLQPCQATKPHDVAPRLWSAKYWAAYYQQPPAVVSGADRSSPSATSTSGSRGRPPPPPAPNWSKHTCKTPCWRRLGWRITERGRKYEDVPVFTKDTNHKRTIGSVSRNHLQGPLVLLNKESSLC